LPLAPSPRSPHTVSVANAKPKAEFEPVAMTTGKGWFVRVTLPRRGNGPHPEPRLGGFKTESEARIWIARKSAAWLREYEGGRYA
jgi:hypothetical protein